MKKIFIIDAVGYIFRSYYAIRPMINALGESTNALFGFIRSFLKLQKDFSPEYVVAVFDGPDNKQSRQAIYAEYKSNRIGMPEDLFPQLQMAKNFCEAYGIPVIEKPGIEADDTIGAVAKWAKKNQFESYICSSDKDLCQLVDENTFILNTFKDNLIIDDEKVREIHGVTPSQITDLLGIMGDTSDNIPGVPGLGPKSASKLLLEFQTLEKIFENTATLKGKKKDLLETHREQALLSKKLATLQLDVEIPLEDTFYLLKPLNHSSLSDFYKEMNFLSLLKDLEPQKDQEEKQQTPDKADYVLITNLQELKTLVSYLSAHKEICFDTETTDLHPMEAMLVGIGFATEEGKAWYVAANADIELDILIQTIKPLFENPSIGFIGHNIKYDLHVMKNHGIEVKTIAFDTMLASYLINSSSNRHGLDKLSIELFGKAKIPIKELLGTGKNQITMMQVPLQTICTYCCEDVDYTLRLKNLFYKQLKELDLETVFYDIELPLIPILLSMESHGIYIDVEKLHDMSHYLFEQIQTVSKEIFQLAGETFNLNSPKQLSQVLFDKLNIKPPGQKKKTSTSTSAQVLESLKNEHPICELVLKYRGLEKLRSTYVDTLPKQVLSKTKRIHCTFNQSVTATGRLSCQDPNLQNIPIRTEEGRKIRTVFKPEKPDYSFLSADYSQIELRIMAHLSKDPELMKAFINHEDIHSFTAAQVFNVPLENINKEMRHVAKAVNFGIIYGQQAYGLSNQLGISYSEAATFIETYFQRYPKVKEFIEDCKLKAHDLEVTKTFTNRRRPLTEINSKNPSLRALGERLAVNTPIQGGQADIIKMAMIEIDKHFKQDHNLGYMILQIHDELIFEIPDKSIAKVTELVKTKMETIVSLSVPLVVDVFIGKNWSEC